jgi:hypothetical protein
MQVCVLTAVLGFRGSWPKGLDEKVNYWGIKCYFIAQILAENGAVNTQVRSLISKI